MQATEKTVRVKHKKNGIEREFTDTQNELMGKQNRKAFRVASPSEAGQSLNTVAEKTEAERLADENADLKARLEKVLAGQKDSPDEDEVTRTKQQLANEGQRAENAKLRAQVTAAESSLESDSLPPVVDVDDADPDDEEGDDDDEDTAPDPDPALTALRKSYEETTGKKPGRLGVDKLNEGIAKALEGKGQGAVQPK